MLVRIWVEKHNMGALECDMQKRAARGQRPPAGEEVRKEYVGKVGIS